VRLDAQFIFKGVHKGSKHVQEHALAALTNHLQNIHVHQCRENDGFDIFNISGVVDLPHNLVRFVHCVYERQSNMARFHLKLGQDGVAKGFRGNARAIGDKKDCS
jgi:hypothetical protein